MWSDCGLTPPSGTQPDGLAFRSAQEVPPSGGRRRLLWLAGADGVCVSHLWFFREVSQHVPVRPGFVHDMVTAPHLRRHGLLRLLIDWADTYQPADSPLYCEDRSLTTDGGPAAVHMRLINAADYRNDWPDRKTYRMLRHGKDHLSHPEDGFPPLA